MERLREGGSGGGEGGEEKKEGRGEGEGGEGEEEGPLPVKPSVELYVDVEKIEVHVHDCWLLVGPVGGAPPPKTSHIFILLPNTAYLIDHHSVHGHLSPTCQHCNCQLDVHCHVHVHVAMVSPY